MFMSQLSETNATLESLTDFKKVSRNVAKAAIKLSQLNYLLGKMTCMELFRSYSRRTQIVLRYSTF